MGGLEHPPGCVVHVYRDIPVVGVYGSDQLPFDVVVVFHHHVFVGGAVEVGLVLGGLYHVALRVNGLAFGRPPTGGGYAAAGVGLTCKVIGAVVVPCPQRRKPQKDAAPSLTHPITIYFLFNVNFQC